MICIVAGVKLIIKIIAVNAGRGFLAIFIRELQATIGTDDGIKAKA